MKTLRIAGWLAAGGFALASAGCDSGGDEVSLEPMLTVRLTVAGKIQTHDPWTTGPNETNEWAKPIYHIWFDSNGNPFDGVRGDGEGPRQAELWLDTGRLGFHWFGPDGKSGTNDDVRYWPLLDVSTTERSLQHIAARIVTNPATPDRGETLEIRLPLRLIGDPLTLDVSFMASARAGLACDHLGIGPEAAICWMVLDDARHTGTFCISDRTGDGTWPGLSPAHPDNFDITSAEIVIDESGVCP